MTKRTVEYVVQRLLTSNLWTDREVLKHLRNAKMARDNWIDAGFKVRILRRETIVKERVVK